MENLKTYYEIVEEIIRGLGLDPEVTRGAKEGQWSFFIGSAEIWVDVWHIEREGRAYMQVISPVMSVPATQREAFFEELLQINDKLFGVAFTVYEGKAWLKVIRECEGLDLNEARSMVYRIGNYADDYDNQLKAKYGGGSISQAGGMPSPPAAI